jgi:D-arginine dehydrogenase
MSTALDSDVIVIGAGIAGASISYFLAPHVRVRVLEREEHPGFHSTGRSAALFSESYGPEQVRRLSRASRGFLERPPPGFVEHPILSPRGVLIVGTAGQAPEVEAFHESVRLTSDDARLVSTREICSVVPVMTPQAASLGVLEPGAADIDVHGLHQGLLRGLKARGGEVRCSVAIRSIGRVQGWWQVEADGQTFRAPLLINAAGAWVDEVAALAGVAPLGIEPRRRSALLFAPPAGMNVAHWPFLCSVDESYYFKPDAGMLLGSPGNADPVPPHDVQPEELDIAIAIDRIEQATTMRIHRPARTWAGLRSFVADGNLVGGFAPDAPGFFWVAALGGYGIQTCAAMGEACANLALERALPAHLTDAGITAELLQPRRNQAQHTPAMRAG